MLAFAGFWFSVKRKFREGAVKAGPGQGEVARGCSSAYAESLPRVLRGQGGPWNLSVRCRRSSPSKGRDARLRLGFVVAAVVALCCGAPLGASAEDFESGLLFSVERTGWPQSFVFGTIHSEDPRVLVLPEKVRQAFDGSEVLAMEVILDEQARQQSLQALRLEEGGDLRSIVGDELYERAVGAAARIGLPESAVRQYKPWAMVTMLSVPPPKTGQVLDLVLYEEAVEKGKPVIGLEGVEEQMDLLATLPEADQVELLRSALDALEDVDALEERHRQLVGIYLEGDLRGLVDLNGDSTANADRELMSRVQKRLIVERNRHMIRRLLPWLQRRPCFVAVGALHLPGAWGMLHLLRERGFKVSKVY